MALQPGEIIDGKYRIVQMMGEGGMGAVYEGENTRIKRRVAIKVLHGAVAEKTDVVQRFEREAQAAGRIGSEHIVEVLDLGNLPSGERFMVMEYLDGEDLTSRIKARKRLAPHECVPIMCQVLDGLAAAHEAGIIHRDLKPDNIYIIGTKAGRADFVKILDFGVSKFSALDNEMSMTRTGAVMGTPYYMSPEQAKGGKIDQRSDLYAMGVVLYQMVTGRVPFNAGSFNELLFKIALESPEPIEELVPECPREFVNLVNKAMSREADGRFQSAQEFKAALEAWAAGAGATEALPAFPDMRSSMASIPEGQQSNPQMAQSNPQMAQANPHMAQSDPQMGQSDPQMGQVGPQMGQAGPQMGQTEIAPPGQVQVQAQMSGGHPQLSHSQAALAVTAGAKNGRGGLMVAMIAVIFVLLGGGAVGAYVLTNQRDEGPKTASTGEADDERDDDAPTREAADLEEEDETDDLDEDPSDLDADPSPTAEPSAEPTSEPTAAPSAPPKSAPTWKTQPPPPPPAPKPQTQPDPEPQPKPESTGRSIKTEL